MLRALWYAIPPRGTVPSEVPLSGFPVDVEVPTDSEPEGGSDDKVPAASSVCEWPPVLCNAIPGHVGKLPR